MHTKYWRLYIITSAIITLSFSVLIADNTDDNSITKSDVLALIPRSFDMLDLEERNRYLALLDMGSEVHPLLREILNEVDDPIIITRILSVFAESKGDKSVALESLTELLSSNRELDNQIKITASNVLGEIGDAQHSQLLYPLIEDNDERVRIFALRAVSNIGGRNAIQYIKLMIADRKSRMSEDNYLRDTTIQEAERAVSNIQIRLSPTGSEHK